MVDGAIAAMLGLMALQLAPLPAGIVAALSPEAIRLQDATSLQPFGTSRPLTIHPISTRQSLMIGAAAALLFWAAREVFSKGGVRLFCAILVWIAAGVSVLALAQHATAPRTIFWYWMPFDPGAQPYGPFINRNHFAGWLILAISLSGGYLAARLAVRIRSREDLRKRDLLLLVCSRDLVGPVAATMLMVAAAAATMSRSGLVGLVAAAAAATALGAGRARRTAAFAVAAVLSAVLLVLGYWLNAQQLADRIATTLDAGAGVSRPMIWQETVKLIAAFPVAGTGAGTFAEAMLHYQQTATRLLFNQAHNEYLHVLAEGGILLAAAGTVLLVGLVLAARQAIRDDRTPLGVVRIAAFAGLIGIAVQSLWETALRTPANLALAAIVAAIAVRPPRAPEYWPASQARFKPDTT